MKKNQSIDDLFKSLESKERANPSPDFLSKMENEALSFVEKRVKYKWKTLLLFLAIIIILVIGNIIVTNYYSTEIDSTEMNLEYELIPIKTIDYEEN